MKEGSAEEEEEVNDYGIGKWVRASPSRFCAIQRNFSSVRIPSNKDTSAIAWLTISSNFAAVMSLKGRADGTLVISKSF